MRIDAIKAAVPMITAARQIVVNRNDTFGLAAKLIREAQLEALANTPELSDDHHQWVAGLLADEKTASNWEVEQVVAAATAWPEVEPEWRETLKCLL